MNKITLLVIMFLITTFTKAQDVSFTLEQEITGNVKVNVFAFGFQSWQIKYWETTMPESSAIIFNAGTVNPSRIAMNPFKSWNFRVKVSFTVPSEWSQIETLTNNCATNPQYVGFTDNFSTHPILNCWRGYYADANAGQYDYILYSSGGAIIMASTMGSKIIVSPRLEDLSTDKKITFKYYGSSAIKVGTIDNPYDISTFHELGSFTSAGNQYQTKTLYLNNYNGTDKYIAFRYMGPSYNNVAIDDFSYEQSINCFDASTITFSNIATNSAEMNFNSNGQTNWEMKLKNTLTNQEQTLALTSGNYSFTNLNPGTKYEVRLRATCAPGLLSNWSPITSFTTNCPAMTSGYYTGFDLTSYFDPCWKRLYTSDPNILLESSSTATAPNNITFIGSESGNTILVSPYTDNFTNKRVRFKLYDNKRYAFLKFPFTIGVLSDPNNAATFLPVKTFSEEEINPIGIYDLDSFWQQYIVNFNSVIPANYHHIGFKIENAAMMTFSEQTIRFDDFYFEDIPTCSEPINVQVLNYDNDQVTLSWESSSISTPSNWEVEYGVSDFVPGTGTVVAANSSTFTVTNLTATTNYDFYVRSLCSNTISNNSVKRSVKTRCVLTAPYTTSFEDAIYYNSYPQCWRRLTPLNRNYYTSPAFYNYVFSLTHTGNNSIILKSEEAYGDVDAINKNILVSPRFSDFNNTKLIKFWVRINSNPTQVPQKIIVGTLSNPDDYTTFTPFEIISYPITSTSQWGQFTVDFSAYNGTDKFIGFKNFPNNNNYNLIIDDFEYLQNPCAKPSSLSAAQSGQNSTTLSWSPNTTENVNWQIEYGEFGFTAGTGIIVNGSTIPFTINNLQINKKYQFRVRNICSNNQVNWSNLYPFKISCQVNAPFYENFDQYQSTPSSGSLPNNSCWSSNNIMTAALYQYYLNNINSPSNVAFVESNSEGEGTIISPYLADFNNTKKIKFWVDFPYDGLNGVSLVIGTIKNPMDLTTFEAYQTIPLENIPAYGKEFQVNFAQYLGNNKHIAFKTQGYNGENILYTTNRIYIDNVYYDTTPTCFEPINITFENTTGTSTLIKWENLNTDQNIQIEYGLTGFTQGAGATLSTNQNEILINNLLPLSNYDFYFKYLCTSDQSVTVGPKKVKTQCDVTYQAPWLENFNNLSTYGNNLLPECFKRNNGTLTTYNAPITVNTNYYQPDQILTGFDDSTYLRAHNGSFASFFTPQFNLTAGTTYKFSLKARKRYEYDFQEIKTYVSKSQELYSIKSELVQNGTLSEYGYDELSYYYTPITSGNYNYLLNPQYSGSMDMIIDNLKLDEGYNYIVNGNRLYNFNAGINPELILEKTQSNEIEIVAMSGNSVLKLSGANNTNFNSQNVWENNQNSISKINFKVDSSTFPTLYLRFDLKQTYNQNPQESAVRVVVNGVVLNSIIYPSTTNQDAFITHQYDLNSFLGQPIRISIQHLGKSNNGIGDNAFINNIVLNPTMLSNNENDFATIKLYPNPTKNNLIISNQEAISQIQIYNISGQLLLNQEFNLNQINLDISKYSSGIYFVNVFVNDKSKLFKIIKE